MECTNYEVDNREWDYDNPHRNFCRCPICRGFLPQDFPLDKPFICKKCGKVIDYSKFIERELKLMKDLEKELSKKHDFDIETHDLNFFGLCKKCKK